MDSEAPKRERRGIQDLYFELLGTHPEIVEEIDDTLTLAASENMQLKIALRTCSTIKDEIEIKCFEHTGRYLDCSIYPVFGLLKLPPKERKPQTQTQNNDQVGDGDGMEFVSAHETKTSRPPKVYEPKLILDGNHRNVINDLLDTFNSEREDAARQRISKMKFIEAKIGKDQVPMLYDLMFKGLKHITSTITNTVNRKEHYDALRTKLSAAKLEQIDWSQWTLDQIKDALEPDQREQIEKNPEAKYLKVFPGWYSEAVNNPKFRVEIDCQLNFCCTEGVYESIACGLIFYEMLRLFKLDKFVVRRENKQSKYPTVLDLFQENSGYGHGQLVWNEKRAQVERKKEEEKRKMALEAQNGMLMEGEGDPAPMLSEEAPLENAGVMEVDHMIEV